jgi:NAD-dependent deacetylase
MPRGDSDIDLSDRERIVFFTGAGLSAESGVPTYRGDGGIWQKYNYEDYACQRAFLRDPVKVWEWHEERRRFLSECAPNRAHEIVGAVQAELPATRIVTQNIDGLHQLGGAGDVIELHGNIWRLRCEREGKIHEDRLVPLESHHCACGEWLRPDIVWFEDPLDMETVQEAIEAIAACDCLISIGTSGSVYPAAELPFLARRAGALMVEINTEETQLSPYFDVRLRGLATEMLASIFPEGFPEGFPESFPESR